MTTKEFYKSIVFQLESSQKAYEDYQMHNQYLNAKTIYSINRNLLNYINSNAHLILEKDKERFQELIRHFSGWMNQFEFEEKIRNPDLDTTFVFERIKGTIAYPTDFYNYLKNKISK